MKLRVVVLSLVAVLGCHAFGREKRTSFSKFFEHSDPTPRIVSGKKAGIVPYMVAIVRGAMMRSLFCGGSIVTPRHILTAAHCILPAGGNEPDENVRAVVGSNSYGSGGTLYGFARGVMHPDYDKKTYKNDIGFLITNKEIDLTPKIQPVVINYDFVGANVPARVNGWGRTWKTGRPYPELLELNTKVVDGNTCVKDVAASVIRVGYRGIPVVNPVLELCTFYTRPLGGNEGGNCYGDSGGPLVRTDRSTLQQIGVVSWGLPCAVSAPDVYARISAYKQFIQTNTMTEEDTL